MASKAGSPPVMENLLHNLNLPRPPQPSCSTFNTSRRNDPSFPPIKMLLDSTPCPTTSIAFSRTSSCFWFLPFSVYLFLSMRLKMLTLSLIVTKPSDSCLPPAITLHSQYFLPLILYLLLTPLEKEMVTHSSILAWRIPWTDEPGGLLFMGSQKVGHDWVTKHLLTLQSIYSGVWSLHSIEMTPSPCSPSHLFPKPNHSQGTFYMMFQRYWIIPLPWWLKW